MTEERSDQAFAYTPGLKIKESTSVDKERMLPIRGEVLVEIGEAVNEDTVIAQTTISGDPFIVDASTRLGILPETLPECVMKKIGEEIKEGETLCQYKMLFGLITRTIDCPVNGTLEAVSDVTGRIIIRTEPIPISLSAYIPGKVADIKNSEGATIQTNAAFIQGIFGIGGEKHGKIKVLVKNSDGTLTPDLITEEHEDCIIIGGSLVTIPSIVRAIQMGVAGIVCGGINSTDLIRFLGKEIGVAITGEEELGLTLIITEGFGPLSMHNKTFQIFQRFNGYNACLNGETQIRAGVIRPEVIIPHKPDETEKKKKKLAEGMVSGTPIRIIRNPYFGAIGKVVSLPVELVELESHSKVRVLEAELENGERVTVPRANVEIIEE
jgi:hypothetical protein